MLPQVDRELLPGATDVPAEATGLLARGLFGLMPAVRDHLPELLVPLTFRRGRFLGLLRPGFGHLMFTDQVLDEVVLAVAGVRAIRVV